MSTARSYFSSRPLVLLVLAALAASIMIVVFASPAFAFPGRGAEIYCSDGSLLRCKDSLLRPTEEFSGGGTPKTDDVWFQSHRTQELFTTCQYRGTIESFDHYACVTDATEPPGSSPPPTSTTPESKQECKKGGWRNFGYSNQGQCIKAVNQMRRR